MAKVFTFTAFFLLPALLTIVLAPKMVRENARVYPRMYTPAVRRIVFVTFYICALGWAVLGMRYLGS